MEIEEAPNNIFYINIFLFTDMSFCGTLNKQNENLLKKNTLDAYSLIIGFKGEKYGDIENNIEYLCKLYEKNLNKILFNKINEIINHKVKNYFTELIIRIYSYNGPIEINYINKEMNSSMKNLTYHEFYSKFLLNSCLLNYKYEECKTRLMKVTTAIKNSEKLNDELKILYNKKRQEMITKDLLEIISGSQVDSME
jgi:F0F1-type ATP synthase gamma subunit